MMYHCMLMDRLSFFHSGFASTTCFISGFVFQALKSYPCSFTRQISLIDSPPLAQHLAQRNTDKLQKTPPSPEPRRSSKLRPRGSATLPSSSPRVFPAKTHACFQSCRLFFVAAQSPFRPEETLLCSFLPPALPYFPF